jgi:ribulose kinase
MKQTAVEWLIEELKGVYESDYLNKLLEQAKAMEKEQMMESYEEGYKRVAKIIEDAAKQNGLNLNL